MWNRALLLWLVVEVNKKYMSSARMEFNRACACMRDLLYFSGVR